MNKKTTKIEARLKSLPRSSGVYLMKDEDGEIIYVGKAIDLSKRVKSYFKNNINEIKTVRLVENIDDLEWLVTNNELEALMLETNLIKKYRPKYNILMKDDKNYAYIKIGKDDFPRVLIVRRVVKDGAWYFGPYTNASRIGKVLRSLNRIFPFFIYQNKSGIAPMNSVAGSELFAKRAQTAWGDLREKEVYQRMITDLKSFLRGKSAGVIRLFKESMIEAAENKNFEQAAILRDRIDDIGKITEAQNVVMPEKIDVDAIGFYGEKGKWELSVLIIRDGKMIDVRTMSAGTIGEISMDELIARFVVDYYEKSLDVPKYIYLPVEVAEIGLLQNFLNNNVDYKVWIKVPQKGDRKRVVELACRNAKLEFLRKQSVMKFARHEGLGIDDLWNNLANIGWDEYQFDKNQIWKNGKFCIEAYDISNLGDTGIVGAMIRWELKQEIKVSKKKLKVKNQANILEFTDNFTKWKGGFNKGMYKRFEIKSLVGQDDFGAMKEMFERRFANAKKDDQNWKYPDLILVDGGKGQLGTVLRVLKLLGVQVSVISLAKREEEIWIGKIDGTTGEIIFKVLELKKEQLANLLMQSIRDEVHRFAVSYQRIVRKKDVRKSVLDGVDGLGPKKKKLLLDKFGSVKGMVEAGEVEVGGLVGEKLACKIFEIL
jgi:excinuclease ABC subunit C